MQLVRVPPRAPPVTMAGVPPTELKRGLPPGEEAPGMDTNKPYVVGRVTALDFLGLSDDESSTFLGFNFAYYREAEIKHGRLAMLAAVAWPTQEIINPILTESFRLKDVLAASNGASPSLLNVALLELETAVGEEEDGR